jgi:hypothetical protein
VGLALVIGTLSFAAAGCGGGSGSGSSGGGSSGTPVNVTLKDYSISLGQSGSLAPGTYTFHVANQGPSAHNLTIDGPDVEDDADVLVRVEGSDGDAAEREVRVLLQRAGAQAAGHGDGRHGELSGAAGAPGARPGTVAAWYDDCC